MEIIDERGIECRGLCFSYSNGEVRLAAYRDHPGVRRNLNEPYFQKNFSMEEWAEVLDYLTQVKDAGPELVVEETPEPEIVEKEETPPVASGTETAKQALNREKEEAAKKEEEQMEEGVKSGEGG